jgi:hypothetical protein
MPSGRKLSTGLLYLPERIVSMEVNRLATATVKLLLPVVRFKLTCKCRQVIVGPSISSVPSPLVVQV